MDLFINSYCHIGQSTISKDGLVLHNLDGIGIEEMLKNGYQLLDLNYPKYYKMDSLSKLGILAAEILLAEVNWEKQFTKDAFAIMLSNSDSSLDTDIKYQKTIAQKNAFFPSPAMFVYTLPNIVAGEIAIKHQLKGENLFYISQSFDTHQTQILVENIFSKPQTSASLVGWVNVLNENYDAFLMLVSPLLTEQAIKFEAQNIDTLYTHNYG